MSDNRTRYGSAWGPYGTASAVSGAMSFGIDDATPDVTEGTFFRTANTGATVVTYFDVREPQGNTSTAHNGKWFTLYFADNLTTIANAGQLYLSGTGGAMTSGQTMTLVYFNSAWYEVGVSQVAGGRETVKTFTLAAGASVNVAGVTLAVLTPSAGAVTISALSGGVIGQQVFLAKDVVSAGTAITLLNSVNFVLAGTTALVMNATGIYGFICDNGVRFRSVAGLIAP